MCVCAPTCAVVYPPQLSILLLVHYHYYYLYIIIVATCTLSLLLLVRYHYYYLYIIIISSTPPTIHLIPSLDKHIPSQDLRPLGSLQKLKHLSLIDNTVTKKADYRLYVLSILPQLKVLDFQKVKDKVRVGEEDRCSNKGWWAACMHKGNAYCGGDVLEGRCVL